MWVRLTIAPMSNFWAVSASARRKAGMCARPVRRRMRRIIKSPATSIWAEWRGQSAAPFLQRPSEKRRLAREIQLQARTRPVHSHQLARTRQRDIGRFQVRATKADIGHHRVAGHGNMLDRRAVRRKHANAAIQDGRHTTRCRWPRPLTNPATGSRTNPPPVPLHPDRPGADHLPLPRAPIRPDR